MILAIMSEEKYYKFWFMFAIVVWLLLAYCALSSKPNYKDKLSNSIKSYLSVCDSSDLCFKKHGFINEESCKRLLMITISNQQDKCTDEFFSSKLSEKRSKELIDACMVNWLEKEFLIMARDCEKNRK